MNDYLNPLQLHDALTLRDLSNPDAGEHAMQHLLTDVTATLTTGWGVPTRTIRDSPLVAVEDNYDKLGFASTDVTRNRRYTRYVSPTVMLRSHTSASMPAMLRAYTDSVEVDELLVMPGLVYRRDAIDRTHVGTPHQVDLWRVSSTLALTPNDLQSMIGELVEAVLPRAQWRAVPAKHPYTTDGTQIDVLLDGAWLELAECGMMPGRLFEEAGLDPHRWSGLALGMGLDRALMLRKGIPDIRLLRSPDERIRTQMLDLTPWRPVSIMPSISRDLSIVVPSEADDETLGDKVRAVLRERSEDLESVQLIAMTSYADLPEEAKLRLQLGCDQSNALLRVTLRPLSRTLTDKEANDIRNEIYCALHQGPVMELIGA